MNNELSDEQVNEKLDAWIDKMFELYWKEQEEGIGDAVTYLVRSNLTPSKPVELSLEWN